MQKKYIKSYDDQLIYCYLWDDVQNPKGIVNIFHGMAEHAGRYEDFAKELNKAGYIVFAEDHRAHGRTSKGFTLGTYQGRDLFMAILLDEIYFSQQLVDKYKLPIYIFGHSFGSFILQAYMSRCRFYDKVILSGSALMKNRPSVEFGRQMALAGKRFFGPDKPAKCISRITFGYYNHRVKKGSWLNSDDVAVADYFKDPYCGFKLSHKFYIDFFKNVQKLYRKKAVEKIDKTKPMLIISGDHDPVGGMSSSVLRLANYYKKLGNNQVKTILYKDARHEILNEPSVKKQVYQDVINFLNEKN